MKRNINCLIISLFILLLMSCGSNSAVESSAQTKTKPASSATTPDENITGEWKLEYIAMDPNGNHILDDVEKKEHTQQADEYFKFNADGSCIFYSIKLLGSYEIKNEKEKKVLRVFDKNNEEAYRFTIYSVEKDQLILMQYGGGGVDFHVFKRL